MSTSGGNRTAAAGDVTAQAGLAAQVTIGDEGPAGQAGISFGPAEDVGLYRYNSDTVRTTGNLAGGANVTGYHDTANSVTIGSQGPSGQAGISFGSGADTRIWRGASGLLSTDSHVQIPDSKQFTFSDVGLGRSAAGTIQASGRLHATGPMVAGDGGGAQTQIGDIGGGFAGLVFDIDTRLSRVAAGRVRLDANSGSGFGFAVGSYAGGTDVGGVLSFGTGAPNNANGNNGDYYLRTDGGPVTHLYFKTGGAWAGLI